MKTMTDALSNFLLHSDNAYICDLYLILLSNGERCCICSGDIDVRYGNDVYAHGKYILKRNQVKMEGSPTVDTLTCTIYDDNNHNEKISGKSVFKAAYEGDLDNANITVYKAYIDVENNNTLVGVLEIFTGICETSKVSGISAQITIKSEASGLGADFPPRIYAPQSAYYTDSNGTIVSSSSDNMTAMIPLKPQTRILARMA